MLIGYRAGQVLPAGSRANVRQRIAAVARTEIEHMNPAAALILSSFATATQRSDVAILRRKMKVRFESTRCRALKDSGQSWHGSCE